MSDQAKDQANKLRDMVRKRETAAIAAKERPSSAARVVTITSGKGGVGKSNLALNLGIQLRKLDMRVAVIDADLGLANIEVLAGVIPKYNFGDVVNSKLSLEQALTEGPMGIKFLSGGAGLTTLARLTDKQVMAVIGSLRMLDDMSDIILIDTGAGISKNVLSFISASSETLLVLTPEPTSMADAYAVVKSMKRETEPMPALKIIVNQVSCEAEGEEIFDKLNKVAEQFLGLQLQSLGSVPQDPCLGRAVKRQEPLCLSYPNSEAAKSIRKLALKLLNMDPEKSGMAAFLRRLSSGLGIRPV
ncbi:MAG: MinD/ParA family protein [Clostridiales bacterium]|nr:MinD/ParA family protein [Clostridiales bacterium]